MTFFAAREVLTKLAAVSSNGNVDTAHVEVWGWGAFGSIRAADE